MKGLMLFLGESFRTGGQLSRIRGELTSVKEQLNACESHRQFIKHISEKFSMEIDVRVSTYDTKYNDLLDYDHAVKEFYEDVIGLNQLFHRSLVDIDNYDFIFYIRIDLFLKEEFFHVFNPAEQILFPSICFKPHHKIFNDPRVNDVMIYIPKKYYGNIPKIVIGHNTWHELIRDTDLTYDDLDTIIHTYHDSDSEKDWNPIYYIVNRPQCDHFHTQGQIFNKKKFNLDYVKFAFFGFYRNSGSKNYNFDIKTKTKFVYTPNIINEDSEEPTESKLANKFGEGLFYTYEYDKQKHIDKGRKITENKFLNHFQQPYRIFSFFYNIRGVLNMIEGDPEDVIFLSRIDIGINIRDNIHDMLDDTDVLLTGPSGFYGTDDKLFVFKLKHKHVFMNLYDDYEKYLFGYLNNIPDHCVDTRPEDIFLYHINKYNLRYKFTNCIEYSFNHICSKFCGHNRVNTET
jgi:hypothetical protein